MAYTNGNLALQPKKKPQQQQKQQQLYRDTKRTVVVKKTLPTKERLLVMLMIAAAVFVAFIVIYRSSQVYEMKYEVKQLTDQQSKLTTELGDLQQMVQTMKDPKTIAEAAEAQGFYYPNNEEDAIKVRKKDTETELARN
ncbi:FtsL-like putative cell division protein [Paenibacillus kobensis]|uniref:FtsL-like putative cell division protein n=1 Tax=Paenibacillus kobensis TaxID=59841 RepID=UPI000FD9B249|nr:FtsL-like putative cell division protein [Paenibacillus kobensis]